MARQENIRLIVLDIDGVLTEGEGSRFDLGLLGELADLNRRSREKDSSVPAVTLCTGRPQPYVEALSQALDCFVPAVFEGGAGIYVPETGRSLVNPAAGDLSAFSRVRDALRTAVDQDGRFYIQLGKEYSVSVFPEDPGNLGLLKDFVRDAAGPGGEEIETAYSASCINVQPKGCGKGAGIGFLSELTGISLEAMLGVGDSEVDLPFLARVGYPSAPGNASRDVKTLAVYVSPLRTADGVRDILARFGVS